jgi:hypothetical protein
MDKKETPVFKQIAIGKGIDQNEYDTIISCCSQAYVDNKSSYSTPSAKLIKHNLKGDWIVVCNPIDFLDFEFSMTKITGSDYVSFTLNDTLFQVCRIKS